MTWLGFLEILKTIGGAAGAIITLTALWGLIAKKPKQWIKNVVKETIAESQNNEQFSQDINKIKTVLDDIKE
jgi:hypothetical protein